MRRFFAHISKYNGKNYFFFTLLMCLMSHFLFSQSAVQFSQYFSNHLVLNPAYAGAEDALSLTMAHRNQWSGVDGAPKTTTLTAHTLFKNQHTGLGVNFFIDQINIHKNVNFSGIYSYRIKTGKNSYLNFGLQAGLYYLNSDYTSLVGGTQIDDPGIGYENISESAFQFGTGMYFKNKTLEIGLSAPILYSTGIDHMDNETSFIGTSSHFFLFARYRIDLSPDLQLKPGFLLKSKPGWPLGYDLNVELGIREVLMVALSYRSLETISSIIQMKVLPQMKIGYSFDFPLSEAQSRNFNSHEIMINYLFKYKDYNVKNPR